MTDVTAEAGFFNDLSGYEEPVLTDGMHEGFITKSEIVKTKKNPNPSWVLTYRDNETGLEHQEWFTKVKPGDDAMAANRRAENYKKYVSRRMTSLGVPESRHATVNPGQFAGTAVYFTLKTNDSGFQSLTYDGVALRDETKTGAASVVKTSAAVDPLEGML